MGICVCIAVMALTAGAQAPAPAPASVSDEVASQDGEPEVADDSVVHADPGILLFRSEDGHSSFWLGSRILVDAGTFAGSANRLPRGTEVRQARIELKTEIDERWASELDVDFADNEVDLKDFWIGYVGLRRTMIKAGNHKLPFSLEEQATSRANTFLERGLPNALVPSRRIGVSYQRWGPRWQAMAGVYGEEPAEGEESGENEGWAAAGRFSYAPILGASSGLHLGVAGAWSTPDAGSDRRVRFRQRPEIHFTERLLNTGKIKDVDEVVRIGFEAAAYSGPWQVQAEYMHADVHRGVGSTNAKFSGGYVFVSRLLFGGKRVYRRTAGEFGRVAIAPGEQALELAIRLSRLDLSDDTAGVHGGAGNNLTLGANWYPNSHVRLMANYVVAHHDDDADGDGDFIGGDDFSALAIRLQFQF